MHRPSTRLAPQSLLGAAHHNATTHAQCGTCTELLRCCFWSGHCCYRCCSQGVAAAAVDVLLPFLPVLLCCCQHSSGTCMGCCMCCWHCHSPVALILAAHLGCWFWAKMHFSLPRTKSAHFLSCCCLAIARRWHMQAACMSACYIPLPNPYHGRTAAPATPPRRTTASPARMQAHALRRCCSCCPREWLHSDVAWCCRMSAPPADVVRLACLPVR